MDAGGRAASGAKAEGNWHRLGGLFQTRLYHGSVFGALSRAAELAERRAWMQVVERRRDQAAEDARSYPAKAGIQEGGPGCQVDCDDDFCRDTPCAVIPALAGMCCLNHWIPAFAGMTMR